VDSTQKKPRLLHKLSPDEQPRAFMEKYLIPRDWFVVIDKSKGDISRYDRAELLDGIGDTYYTLNRIRKNFPEDRVKPTKLDINGLRAWGVDLDPDPKDPTKTAKPVKEIFRRYRMLSVFGDKNRKLVAQIAYILQEIVDPVMTGQRGLIPTLLIFSGRGIQMIWFADKMYGLKSDNNRSVHTTRWEGYGRALIAQIGGDAVFNIDRLLRLPGYTNSKTGFLARVLEDTENRYTPAQMFAAYGEPPAITVNNKEGVNPAEFKDVDWKKVYSTIEEFDLDDVLLGALTEDIKRDAELENLIDGTPLVGQYDTSGSGFDVKLIGSLKRKGYEPEQAFQVAMIAKGGSGPKHALQNDSRYFQRCWANSAGDTNTTPESDFNALDYSKEPEPIVQTQTNPTKAHKLIVDNYHFVATSNRVIHNRTGDFFDIRGFDAKFSATHTGGRDGLPKASALLVAAKKQVDKLTWMPGADQVFIRRGLTYFNLYIPETPDVTVEFTPGSTGVYHKAAAWTIPQEEHRETLMDHMAYSLQFPGNKINWHPCLYSTVEGSGKDTVLEAIVGAVGRHNSSSVEMKNLIKEFNSALRFKKIVCINEVMSFSEGKAVSNALKPILASPPHTLQINVKYEPEFEQPNVASIYMTSNSKRPVHVSSMDRRMWFIHCREQMMPKELADEIWEWFNNGPGHQLMYQELMARDVSKFDPARRPASEVLMADHKNMQMDSMSNSESIIQDNIDAHRGVFCRDIVLKQDLIDFARDNRMLISTVEDTLDTLGCWKLRRKSVRIDGLKAPRRITMWVVRSPEDYLKSIDPNKDPEPRRGKSWRDLYDVAVAQED